ncbi:hypothetical protein IFO70_10225 [Phormidium tenue FACHB-886]|nr:hypothetical protein [Phormidium tenue FACHB-886]
MKETNQSGAIAPTSTSKPARRKRGEVTAPKADEQVAREREAANAAEHPITQRFQQTEQTVTGLLNARDAYVDDRIRSVGQAFETMESDVLLGVADYLNEGRQAREALGNAPFQCLVDKFVSFSNSAAPAEAEGARAEGQ